MINQKTEILVSDKTLRNAIYIAFGGNCFYTGRKVDFNEMHIDHIIPRKEGGTNCIENYVLSCAEINLKKTGRKLTELIRVSLEVNKALYVPLVIKTYNELHFNEMAFTDYIEVNKYCLKNNIEKKQYFSQLAQKKLTCIKKPKLGQSRNKLYFKKEELDELKNCFYKNNVKQLRQEMSDVKRVEKGNSRSTKHEAPIPLG